MTSTLAALAFAAAPVAAPVGRAARKAAIAMGNNVAFIGIDHLQIAAGNGREAYIFAATRFAAQGVARKGFDVYSYGADVFAAVVR